MVHFHAVGHVSDATSIALKFVSDEGNFMASLDKALSKLIAVSFNTSKLWKGKVSANKNAILSIRPDFFSF